MVDVAIIQYPGDRLRLLRNIIKKFRWIRLYNEVHKFSINKGSGRKLTLQLVGKKAFPFIQKFKTSIDDYHFPMLINPDFATKTGVIDKINNQGIDLSDTKVHPLIMSKEKTF